MQNKSWRTVYIRVADYEKIMPSGNPQYKWVAIGRMYGYGTINKNYSVVFDK